MALPCGTTEVAMLPTLCSYVVAANRSDAKHLTPTARPMGGLFEVFALRTVAGVIWRNRLWLIAQSSRQERVDVMRTVLSELDSRHQLRNEEKRGPILRRILALLPTEAPQDSTLTLERVNHVELCAEQKLGQDQRGFWGARFVFSPR